MTTELHFFSKDALTFSDNVRAGLAKLGMAPRVTGIDADQIVRLKPSNALVNENLPRTSKKYIVPFGGKFYSFPLRVGDHPTSKDLYKMYGPIPNIFREGMVLVDGEVYFVKIEDLKRGIVRKSRKLPIPAKRTITYKDLIDGLACTNFADLPEEHPQSAASIAARRAGIAAVASTLDAASSGTGDQQSPRLASSAELDEELRLANMAFEEQVGTLYDYDSPEEDWQDEDDS